MSDLEEVVCPGCKKQEAYALAKVRLSPVRVMSTLNRCNHCGLGYVSPRPTPEYEKRFYEEQYYEAAGTEEWRDNRLGLFEMALQRMEKRTSKTRVLDVGCGAGYFLNMAHEKGWGTHGLEISKQAAEHARNQFGLEVEEAGLESLNLKKNVFSAITFWNVLDQIPDTQYHLKRSYDLLKPGGVIALRVSNLTFHLAVHFFWEVFKRRKWVALESKGPTVFHIEMFDAKSIRTLLKNAGFESIEIWNSPLAPQPKAAESLFRRATPLVALMTYFFVELLRMISLGHWVIGPSLFVIGRKA